MRRVPGVFSGPEGVFSGPEAVFSGPSSLVPYGGCGWEGVAVFEGPEAVFEGPAESVLEPSGAVLDCQSRHPLNCQASLSSHPVGAQGRG